jgi:hypothetical protein
MTAYNFIRSIQISPDVFERKEKRKKMIQAAQELERRSYLAMMERKRKRI